jgi:hypothetical protein
MTPGERVRSAVFGVVCLALGLVVVPVVWRYAGHGWGIIAGIIFGAGVAGAVAMAAGVGDALDGAVGIGTAPGTSAGGSGNADAAEMLLADEILGDRLAPDDVRILPLPRLTTRVREALAWQGEIVRSCGTATYGDPRVDVVAVVVSRDGRREQQVYVNRSDGFNEDVESRARASGDYSTITLVCNPELTDWLNRETTIDVWGTGR